MLKKGLGRLAAVLVAPNLPVVAGFGVRMLGLLMLLLALKNPWFRVPVDLAEQMGGKDGGGALTAVVAKSSLELPMKGAVLLAVAAACVLSLRRRHDAYFRARVTFCLGLFAFVAGPVFSHLTIVGEAELSHRAAWILSEHDNLTWLGGDIYTAREYEPIGGGLDLMAKDPQQILGCVPPPYPGLDLGSLHDVFDWLGLGAPFTAFMRKGWGFLMVGGILLMVGGLATRMPGEGDRLSSRTVSFGLRAAGGAVLVGLALAGARVTFAAKALNRARDFGDVADYGAAVASMESAARIMPCLAYDTGLILQRGLYEYQARRDTPAARYFEAVQLETADFKTRAEAVYVELLASAEEPIRREAYRSLFRLGVIDFNSGQETGALSRVEGLVAAFPTLPKACYVRLLLAVRLGETEVAFRCQRSLYAIAGTIGLSEKSAYLSSGHQHLAELAHSDGDYDEAWRQYRRRIELEK